MSSRNVRPKASAVARVDTGKRWCARRVSQCCDAAVGRARPVEAPIPLRARACGGEEKGRWNTRSVARPASEMGFFDAARAFGAVVHPLHYAKAWYFVSFAAYACMTPYLPLFYERWGLSSTEIGYVNALRPLVGFVATPAWGWVADVTGRHNAIFFWKTVCQAAGYTALGWFVPKTFAVIFAYVLVLEGTCAATMTLADTATGTMCRRAAARGETPAFGTSYGEIRLWGAVSWGFIFGPLMGALLTYLPTSAANRAPFVAYPVLLAMSAATTLGFDFAPLEMRGDDGEEATRARGDDERSSGPTPEKTREGASASDDETLLSVSTATATIAREQRLSGADEVSGAKEKESSESVAAKTFRATTHPAAAATFLAFLVMSASMAVTDTYLFLWMEQLGASRLCMGVALGFTCVSEVVVFKKEARIKKAISTEGSVVLILFCYAARQWFYAALPFLNAATPLGTWIVLPAQLLHGVTFGLFWSVGTAFAQKIAPEGAASAVMGVFGGANAGGSFLGSVLGGVAFRKHGGDGLFGGIGVMNFVLGCLAYVVLKTPLIGGLRRSRSLSNLATTRRRTSGAEVCGWARFFFARKTRGSGWQPVAADEVEMSVSSGSETAS